MANNATAFLDSGAPMPVTQGVKQLVAQANLKIETWSLETALQKFGTDNVVFVDIRDVRELWRDGKVPGAVHAPRGMLEFWFDPDSPYHKPLFADDSKKFVLYCRSGWRSALATAALKDMGLDNVAHIDGGYSGWIEAGGASESVDPKSK